MDNSYIVVLMYKKASHTSYNRVQCQEYANNEYTAVAKACRLFQEIDDEVEDVVVISVVEE